MTEASATTHAQQAGAGELAEIFRLLQKQRRTGTLKVAGPGGRVRYVYIPPVLSAIATAETRLAGPAITAASRWPSSRRCRAASPTPRA